MRDPPYLHYPLITFPTITSSHFSTTSYPYTLNPPSSLQKIMLKIAAHNSPKSGLSFSYYSPMNSSSLKRTSMFLRFPISSEAGVSFFLFERYTSIVGTKGAIGGAAVLLIKSYQACYLKNEWQIHSSRSPDIYFKFICFV